MEEIIERLKSQKKAAEQDFWEEGHKEGATWAKSADYLELKYAATTFDLSEDFFKEGGIHRRLLLEDDILGDSFQGLDEERPSLLKANEDGLISTEAENFLNGWLKAVVGFWKEVAFKL